VIHPNTESGDIYSLTYSSKLSTLFFGCQNTSIQWIDLSFATSSNGNNSLRLASLDGTSTPGTPGKKFHKFFDSVPQAQRHHQPQQQQPTSRSSSRGSTKELSGPKEVLVPAENIILPAHYGYVYCMSLSSSYSPQPNEEVYLLSGSGDEDIKVSLALHKLTCCIDQYLH
jgi:di- and tripeptidase